MKDKFIPYDNQPCWVSVYARREQCAHYCIGFDLTLPQMLARQPEMRLLYYRQFVNLADGLAHKLLLEQLSADSIDSLIARYNSTHSDLYNEFNSYHN